MTKTRRTRRQSKATDPRAPRLISGADSPIARLLALSFRAQALRHGLLLTRYQFRRSN